MSLLRYLWTTWSIFYFRQARDALTKHQPTHPDLPEVVLKLSSLEAQRKEML
jgi:hypothetical protein